MKIGLVAAAMVLAVAGTASAQSTTQVPATTSLAPGADMVGVPGCHFGEQVDGTTAAQAAAHAKAAGFTSITGLKKSCDNNWHGQAMMNGAAVNVMITPDGRVVREGS